MLFSAVDMMMNRGGLTKIRGTDQILVIYPPLQVDEGRSDPPYLPLHISSYIKFQSIILLFVKSSTIIILQQSTIIQIFLFIVHIYLSPSISCPKDVITTHSFLYEHGQLSTKALIFKK